MYKWLCACKCTHFWVSESKNKSLSSFQKGLYSKLLLFFNILHISLFQYLTYYLSLCSLNRNSSVSIFLGGDSRYHKKIGTRKRKKLVNRGCVIKSAPSVGYWGITAGTLGVSSAQNYRPQRVCNLKNFHANQSKGVVSAEEEVWRRGSWWQAVGLGAGFGRGLGKVSDGISGLIIC